MNKQEQIEKMTTMIACGNCGRCSWDCPEDCDGKCYVKEGSKPTANLLVSKGYINGADFVEWLKKSKYVKPYMDDVDYCFGINVERLDEALQEYLKGE